MLVVDKSQVAGKQVAPPASYSTVPVAVDVDTQSLLQGGREYQKPDPEAVKAYLKGDDYEDIKNGFYVVAIGGDIEQSLAALTEAAPFIDLEVPYNGMNPLTYGAQRGYLPSIKWFLENENPNFQLNPFLAQQHNGRTALHAAAQSGSLDVLEYLLDYAVNQMGLKEKYNTLSEVEIKRQLLEMKDKDGNTCLHYAAGKDQLDMVKFLIDTFNVNTTVKNKLQISPFAKAVNYPPTCRVMNYFITKYALNVAQPEQPNDGKVTPMHHMDNFGLPETISRFLNKARGHSQHLFEVVVCQIVHSENKDIAHQFSLGKGVREYYDALAPGFKESLQLAIDKASQTRDFKSILKN